MFEGPISKEKKKNKNGLQRAVSLCENSSKKYDYVKLKYRLDSAFHLPDNTLIPNLPGFLSTCINGILISYNVENDAENMRGILCDKPICTV